MNSEYFSSETQWLRDTPEVWEKHGKILLVKAPHGNIRFRMIVSHNAPDGSDNPGHVLVMLHDIDGEN